MRAKLIHVLEGMPALWRQRLVGLAIGTPAGIAAAVLTWWISR